MPQGRMGPPPPYLPPRTQPGRGARGPHPELGSAQRAGEGSGLWGLPSPTRHARPRTLTGLRSCAPNPVK